MQATAHFPISKVSSQGSVGMRRATDLAFAIVVFGLFWWLLLAVWLAVKADSKGPAIYRQERVGRRNVRFTCYKFRTMFVGAPLDASHRVDTGNVTRVGQILRRLKLDELPQVINIIRGEMTLIGPRPCLPIQRELTCLRQQKGIDNATPGITGLAQVNGIDMSDPQRLVEVEARYMRSVNIRLDMFILLRTFGIVRKVN